MTKQRSASQAPRDLAAMVVCLLLVIVCTGFASQGWALMISFDGRPPDTADAGLRTLAIVAAALAIIAVLDGFVGHSWSSAGVIGAHAGLTVAHPNLWLLSALPAIITLLAIALSRMNAIRKMAASAAPHERLS